MPQQLKKITNSKIRPIVKYFGGKFYLSNKLLPLFPSHSIYIEPFLGAGSILINKSISQFEIGNDLNNNMIDIWKACQNGSLYNEIKNIEYSQDNFEKAKQGQFSSYVNEYILRRMSRCGLMKDFAWSARLRGGQPGDINAWESAKDNLIKIQNRIKSVQFNNTDALELIRDFNHPSVLFYLDPPYLKSTRTTGKEYNNYEMPENIHISLLNCIVTSKAQIIISGYNSDLYSTYLSKWNKYEFELANHSGQNKKKQRRVEVAWTNGNWR